MSYRKTKYWCYLVFLSVYIQMHMRIVVENNGNDRVQEAGEIRQKVP